MPPMLPSSPIRKTKRPIVFRLLYSYGRLFSLVAWLYIIIVGFLLLSYDKGSKLNDLMKEDNI